MTVTKKKLNPLTGRTTVREVKLCNGKLKLYSEVVNNVEVIHTVEKEEY